MAGLCAGRITEYETSPDDDTHDRWVGLGGEQSAFHQRHLPCDGGELREFVCGDVRQRLDLLQDNDPLNERQLGAGARHEVSRGGVDHRRCPGPGRRFGNRTKEPVHEICVR